MDTTIEFARRELNKYLFKMTGDTGCISLSAGTDEDLFRERCVVSVRGGRGKLEANCPRALLLGVYAFLRACGCRFLRPGIRGEYLPHMNIEDVGAEFVFEPKQRHRGITIEGAVSLEHVLALIDWAPKAGFNSYFTQFRTSYEFFDRWYSHKSNPTLNPEPMSEERAESFIARIAEEMKMRAMIRHGVGHGWTNSCLGVSVNGWTESEDELPPDKIRLLAETDGKRGYFKNKPLNTHLCYSKPEARILLAEEVVDYAAAHPEIDVLHFWLADDYNNACECENCARLEMSDWYVMILNEIDRRLTARGIRTKIVFLVYLELFWPPRRERIENPDRFIMMFAPIFRTYTEPYDVSGDWKSRPLPEYRKNKMEYPQQADVYLAFLAAWKRVFTGDSFDFDYHLMWDINRDLGGETLARVLYEDIRSLPEIGLNGYMSCQIQRAFYPSGLPMYVMGKALSEGGEYEAIRAEYYDAAFGVNRACAEKCYAALERLIPFRYLRGETGDAEAEPVIRAAQTEIGLLIESLPAKGEDSVRTESLDILRFALENARNFVRVIALKLSGAPQKAVDDLQAEMKAHYNAREARFQTYTDGFYFNMILDGFIAQTKSGIYA